MSPTAVDSTLVVPVATKGKVAAPLQTTGALKDLESVEISPSIGREYPKADLAELLRAPNSDELIRDLAVTSKYTTTRTSSLPQWFSYTDLILKSLSAVSWCSARRIT